MAKQKFAVIAEDQNGDLCMVESDRRDSAEAIAKKFREDGYQHVRILENSNAG